MDNNTRYVIGGSELGRAPALKKCPMCGGVADYISVHDTWKNKYRVVCGQCGLATAAQNWPESAGLRWNVRDNESARVITTQEILEFRADMTDGRGNCACWLETIEGDITAICLSVSASDEGREVYENGYGDFWERDRIDAEGITWRLWDKRPTMSDMEREPWGRVGYKVMSDAARAEAERIRAELDEKQRERQRQQAEARRRHCLYCANHVPVDTESRDLGSATPFVCALTGEQIENPGSRSCREWRDRREAGA